MVGIMLFTVDANLNILVGYGSNNEVCHGGFPSLDLFFQHGYPNSFLQYLLSAPRCQVPAPFAESLRLRPAALDTTKSHRYANIIVGLVSNMDGEFPKELLVVWWA